MTGDRDRARLQALSAELHRHSATALYRAPWREKNAEAEHLLYRLESSDGSFFSGFLELFARRVESGSPVERAVGTGVWGAWFDAGMPRLVLSERQAASMMATRFSAEDMPEATPPWPCFMVDVPKGLVPISADIWADAIWVWRLRVEGRDLSMLAVVLSDGNHLFQLGDALVTDGSLSLSADAEMWHRGLTATSDQVERATEMLSSLARSACFALAEHRPTTTRASGTDVRRNCRGEPKTWTMQWGQRVTVDVRGEILDYVRGSRRSAPRTQTMVRGHWKWQPFGAGASLRKWLHVAVYWRGPEDAPIAVRTHEIEARE